MIGLLNKKNILSDEALVITRCQSIHMFFMRFPIDAIFVGRDNCVVGLVENIKPFQLSRVFLKASYVVETPVGVIAKTQTGIGDKIAIESK